MNVLNLAKIKWHVLLSAEVYMRAHLSSRKHLIDTTELLLTKLEGRFTSHHLCLGQKKVALEHSSKTTVY